jgi:hypothetical protein
VRIFIGDSEAGDPIAVWNVDTQTYRVQHVNSVLRLEVLTRAGWVMVTPSDNDLALMHALKSVAGRCRNHEWKIQAGMAPDLTPFAKWNLLHTAKDFLAAHVLGHRKDAAKLLQEANR